MFASSAEALRVELEELGDAILLDREKRVVWIGFLAKAFLYLTAAVAFEDLPDDDEEDEDNPQRVDLALQIQLLDWLDRSLHLTDGKCHARSGLAIERLCSRLADTGGKNLNHVTHNLPLYVRTTSTLSIWAGWLKNALILRPSGAKISGKLLKSD